MLSTEAHLETARSNRYLVQLCRHFSHETQNHPHVQVHVEWSDERGLASFGWGRCKLHASPGMLVLRVEASDEAGLRRMERLLAEHLERFAGSGHLTLAWSPAESVEGQLSTPPPGREDNADG